MKVYLQCFRCYNYVGKDNQTKSGTILIVRSINPVSEDDGKGNITFGYPVEEVFVRLDVLGVTLDQLAALVSHNVELVYTRTIGERFERLSAINDLGEGGEF